MNAQAPPSPSPYPTHRPPIIYRFVFIFFFIKINSVYLLVYFANNVCPNSYFRSETDQISDWNICQNGISHRNLDCGTQKRSKISLFTDKPNILNGIFKILIKSLNWLWPQILQYYVVIYGLVNYHSAPGDLELENYDFISNILYTSDTFQCL